MFAVDKSRLKKASTNTNQGDKKPGGGGGGGMKKPGGLSLMEEVALRMRAVRDAQNVEEPEDDDLEEDW